MVRLRGHKLNSELMRYIREHPHLKNGRSRHDQPVVYRATKWRLQDRLTEVDMIRLVMAFQTGIATRELAARYAINVKSVRKVLREHRATKLLRPTA